MEINKIKCNKPGLKIREITTLGEISDDDWKKLLNKIKKDQSRF